MISNTNKKGCTTKNVWKHLDELFLGDLLNLGVSDYFVYNPVPSTSLSSSPYTSHVTIPFPPHQNIKYKINSKENYRSPFASISGGFTWEPSFRILFKGLCELSEHRMLIFLCGSLLAGLRWAVRSWEDLLSRGISGRETETQTDVTVMRKSESIQTA